MDSDSASPVRMAVYGTKHSHAAGVTGVMAASRDVDVAGVYEPDRERRRELEGSGAAPWSGLTWFDDKSEMLDDPAIAAIASEGSNLESLDQTEEIVSAGKHVLYDKPAGDDYAQFERVIAMARERGLLVQLGYMWRRHDGLMRIADWARSGFLGDVFAIRAHLSTNIPVESQDPETSPAGGVFYDLASHVLDQIVWTLGRPGRVTSFLREDVNRTNGFPNNSLGVFEFDNALAFVDIAAMEPRPPARRYEVYGTVGSAIIEPIEPARHIRLALEEPRGGYDAGVTLVEVEDRPRYVASLAAFVREVRGEKEPDRPLDHELLVQETLLRATGRLPS